MRVRERMVKPQPEEEQKTSETSTTRRSIILVNPLYSLSSTLIFEVNSEVALHPRVFPNLYFVVCQFSILVYLS